MTTKTETLGVGLHEGVPSAVYHADPCAQPSLSSGIARIIVEQTPAHARLKHPRLGGTRDIEATREMDFGGLVHALLAGQPEETAEYVVSEFDEFRTKEARSWRDEVRASGRTPVKKAMLEAAGSCAGAMKKAISQRPDTLNPFDAGKPEVTAIWQESDLVTCRARIDRLVQDAGGFCDVWDFKTCASVSADSITRTIIDHGYNAQAAFYLRGLRQLLPDYAGRFSFLFAFIEADPPHTVRVVPMTEAWLSFGNMIVSRAIALWGECMATNTWPSYSGTNLIIEPPSWYAAKLEGLSP
ncbi:MAG: PD-(D/E)XK nuclease-like domain-containing protein [Candidatus Hydrogenedentales bacterium]|jgi:hypothetical protein